MDIDTSVISLTRQYKLGVRYITVLGEIFKYCKLDFGNLSEDAKTNLLYNYIEYRWIRVYL